MKIGKIITPEILELAKNLDVKHNVQFRVLDKDTHEVISVHEGHNAATNSMLLGMAHYLTGDGVLNQAWDILRDFVPQYLSLGTMGLINQNEDAKGYPAGIGVYEGKTEAENYQDYFDTRPGYGADGYDKYSNNGRAYFGLGPTFENRPNPNKTINCELINTSYPRIPISYREIVPETKSEIPETIDVVFSGMVSTGALAKFREKGKDYIFITEAGMWSRPDWVDGGSNGLLAAYRILPPDQENWDMSVAANRQLLRNEIIKVNRNQVVQVIWKIQLGGVDQLGTCSAKLKWIQWDGSGDSGPAEQYNNKNYTYIESPIVT